METPAIVESLKLSKCFLALRLSRGRRHNVISLESPRFNPQQDPTFEEINFINSIRDSNTFQTFSMRILNYATTDANPFHRDHRSASIGRKISSTNLIKTNETFSTASTSFETNRSPQKWSGASPLADVYPPETVYANTKDIRSISSVLSEDTYSEITSSGTGITTSSSHTTSNHRNGETYQAVEISSTKLQAPEILRPPNHHNRSPFSRDQEATKGKFDVMTLAQTLSWRRHASSDDQVDTAWERNNKNTVVEGGSLPRSKHVDPLLATMKASAKVKRHLALAKERNMAKDEDRSKLETTSEFMSVRARLKRAKLRNMLKSCSDRENNLVRSEIKSSQFSGDVNQAPVGKLNPDLVKRCISGASATCKAHKTAQAVSNPSKLHIPKSATTAVGRAITQQKSIVHRQESDRNSNDTSICSTPTAIDTHQLARAMLKSMFAERFAQDNTGQSKMMKVGNTPDSSRKDQDKDSRAVESDCSNTPCNSIVQPTKIPGPNTFTRTLDGNQVAREKLNSMLAKRCVSEPSGQAGMSQSFFAIDSSSPDGLNEGSHTISLITDADIPQKLPQSNSDDSSVRVATHTCEEHKVAKEKLCAISSQRRGQQFGQVEIEMNSTDAQDNKAVAVEIQCDGIESKLSHSTTVIEFCPKQVKDQANQKQVQEKLNGILSLRKHASHERSKKSAGISSKYKAKQAIRIRDSIDSRDDTERQYTDISGRDSSESLDTSKYSKMLKMGIPVGAIKNCMTRDGVSPLLLFGGKTESEQIHQPRISNDKPKKDQYRRTRLHWNEIERFSENSIWQHIKADSEMSKYLIFICEISGANVHLILTAFYSNHVKMTLLLTRTNFYLYFSPRLLPMSGYQDLLIKTKMGQ